MLGRVQKVQQLSSFGMRPALAVRQHSRPALSAANEWSNSTPKKYSQVPLC